MLPEAVTEKLESLPARPGCYLFRDKEGGVLYVGKAKSLRARVRSYFQESGSDTRAFIPSLPRWMGDLETFVTNTEKEAAILENSLIKEHRPRLNVKLRDDKEYLTLRLNKKADWPRLELVRRPAPDGANYFGPFNSATAARRTLHLVEKHFQLRTCSDRELKSRSRPCIQYQIQRCPAPCVLSVDSSSYKAQVDAVDLFLSGRHDELTNELSVRMAEASKQMAFEVAAIYRDQLSAVKSVREKQRVVAVSDVCQDVLGLYREGDLVELSVVYVRLGRVVEIFNISHARTSLPDDEVVASFLREHYREGGLGSALIPEEVIVPVLPEGAEGVEEWLTERRVEILTAQGVRRTNKCALFAPQRGPRKQLLDLARENAAHAFLEKRRADEDIEQRLLSVQEKLRLPRLPRRIECCDISHLGGEATVGSVVSLHNGAPDKRNYKAYKVRSVSDGDDYQAMFEVLSRRFARGIEAQKLAQADKSSAAVSAESSSTVSAESGADRGSEGNSSSAPPAPRDPWALPDLFVVDGGRGQLGVALAAAGDLGLRDLPIVGLAKERETVTGDKMVDRVYLPGQKNPINLRPNTPELFMLALARDEAHRFANVHRSKIGKKRRFTSQLDEIPGIGPKTRKALLTALGSVAAIKRATDEEILGVAGVSKKVLAALRDALGSSTVDEAGSAGPVEAPSSSESET
jgi:excinuclease ABC subunit C